MDLAARLILLEKIERVALVGLDDAAVVARRFGEDGRAAESWLEVGAWGVLRALDVLEMVNPVRVVES